MDWSCFRYEVTEESHQYRTALQRPIESYSVSESNYWIPKFILEVRKRNSSRYPQNTLVSIIAGLQTHLHSLLSIPYQFFKDKLFLPIQQSLNCAMKLSVKENIGIHAHQARVVKDYEENVLWEKGELGSSTPTKLIQTLFYLNGLHFGIRGGAEHHNLCIDQFQIEIFNGIECLVYKEKSSKTYKGGMEQRKLSPKVKRYFENTDLPKENATLNFSKCS